MKIGLASDHRGYTLKEALAAELIKRSYEIEDFGTNSSNSTDYPDYAFKLGEAIVEGKVDYGVAICGSGIGISIACNKVKGIRCARVVNHQEAVTTRIDNNSNIVAFGETIPLNEALQIVTSFVNTNFSEEEKHHRRVDKIIQYEEGTYDV